MSKLFKTILGDRLKESEGYEGPDLSDAVFFAEDGNSVDLNKALRRVLQKTRGIDKETWRSMISDAAEGLNGEAADLLKMTASYVYSTIRKAPIDF